MTAIKRIMFIIIAVYLALLAALYMLQRSVLYIPPDVYFTPAGIGLSGAQEVYAAEDEQEMLGWWMPPNKADAPTVMFFHGNGSAVYSNHEIYRQLHAQGFGLFALAYPGYPGRAGQTTQESLTRAAENGYDFVASKSITADKIVYYGTSLGAGVAAQLSVTRPPALIVMEAPFTSAAEMGQLRFPIFPAAFLTKDKFRSDKALSGFDIPLLWLHGTQDRVIPLAIGQKLYEGYDGPKTPYVIEGGRHTDLWHRGGSDAIIAAIRKNASTPSLIETAR